MLLCLPETGIQREVDKGPMVMGLGSAKSSTECMFFIHRVSAFLFFVLFCFVFEKCGSIEYGEAQGSGSGRISSKWFAA
jgi:hypothetical protein